VRRILAKHYVHRNQAELVKSTIKERGSHKVIDTLSVELNEKGGFYEVEFTNLGLKKVAIHVDVVKRYPKLLVGGIWAIIDVEYELPADPKASPWRIAAVKPIKVAGRAHAERGLQPRAVHKAGQVADPDPVDPLLRAQLQPAGARPQGHG
jgi:ATP-dependent Lon protease